jgi:hypothetical protein
VNSCVIDAAASRNRVRLKDGRFVGPPDNHDGGCFAGLEFEIVRVHPIRHDRAKEHGAFATPNGQPRQYQDAPASAGVKATPLRLDIVT